MKNPEIRGQYASDNWGREKPHEDPTGTLGARGDGRPGMHTDGLFDELSGTPDPVTGLTGSYPDEPTELGLTVVTDDALSEEALDAVVGMVGDDAAAWLDSPGRQRG